MTGQEVLKYRATQLMTANADYLGRELFRAALRDCLAMDEALREQRWDRLVQAGSHAQEIFAGLHDMTRRDMREGQLFRALMHHLWNLINVVLQRHQDHPIKEIQGALEELIRQLDSRLIRDEGEAALTPLNGGWTE